MRGLPEIGADVDAVGSSIRQRNRVVPAVNEEDDEAPRPQSILRASHRIAKAPSPPPGIGTPPPSTSEPIDAPIGVPSGIPIDVMIEEPDSVIVLDDVVGSCPGCVGAPGTYYARAEVLGWWIDGFSVPALVTTSPTGTAREDAGVLGTPGAAVLFGDDALAGDLRLGGRLTVGGWLGAGRHSGIEAIYFGLMDSGSSFAATSNGDPILARPFFNVEPGLEGQDSELVAFPGELSGSVSVSSNTKLYGLEILYRHALSQEWPRRVDLVAGWRYNRLEDDLLITDSKEVLSGATGLAVGTTLSEFDHFLTENTFHGAEVGVVYERWWCKWAVEGVLKVALGNTHSEALVDGSTTVTVPVPGGPDDVTVTPQGLLAQQSNIGSRERDEFAVIPELGINVGYDVTCNMRAMVGYSFIYWSRVARPGDQIDTDLNLSQIPPGTLNGIPRPEFRWAITDMWVQGVNAGIDYRF